ncbi:hypothetical protein [Burkholderia oklahomensis]|nr:hypothetical protein [Burkholderia oklahomensis]MBI0362465.1 hypothetical protein [Burkholderia oklahomensis]QPS40039.1 hypothetical protein I6G57_30140 [Burkholderia oklahomensis]
MRSAHVSCARGAIPSTVRPCSRPAQPSARSARPCRRPGALPHIADTPQTAAVRRNDPGEPSLNDIGRDAKATGFDIEILAHALQAQVWSVRVNRIKYVTVGCGGTDFLGLSWRIYFHAQKINMSIGVAASKPPIDSSCYFIIYRISRIDESMKSPKYA